MAAAFHQYPLLLGLGNLRSSTFLCFSRRFQASHLANGWENGEPPLTTASIQALCRAGKTELARKLFDKMPDKNIFAFSSMIYGYSSNGFHSESFKFLSHMQKSGTHPNSFTMVAVLLSSAGMGAVKLGESIHGSIVKSGLGCNPFVRTAMLDSYAKCGNSVNAYTLFQEMAEPNLVTCNAMIAGFVRNDLFCEALLLFKKLWVFGLVPNCVTMISVAQSCIGYGAFVLCKSMHAYVVKAGFDSDVSVMNSVFEMYLSYGDMEIAQDFFRKMAVLDVVTWTTMMGFLLKLERGSEALSIFIQMRTNGIKADMVSMVNVLVACALEGDLRRGRSVHSQIVILGFEVELPVMNSLIAMYSKCGDLHSARILFDRIMDKSLISWTAIISGYVQNRQPREGLDLLIRMRKEENYNIDSVIMVILLSSCGELANLELSKQFHAYSFVSGLVQCNPVQNSLVAAYGKCGCIDHAARVFKDINCRDTISWNAMIASYGINGEGETAVALFQEMETSGIEPDSLTYLNLLTACSHSGLVDDGLAIFERMVKEKRIELRGEHCGCVIDMLARAGRLGDASNLVNSIREEVGPNVWKALLSGCRINNDVELAEFAAGRVSRVNSRNSDHVVLLSNVYASVGRFESVEALRSKIGKKDLLKNLGFSSLDCVPRDVG